MIDIEFVIAADCEVAPEEIRKLVEGLIVDAVADDVRQQLAALVDPETGEHAELAIKGSLGDALDFEFSASSLELVEMARRRFGDYAPLAEGHLKVAVSGRSRADLRFGFAGSPALVAIVERRLRRGLLGRG